MRSHSALHSLSSHLVIFAILIVFISSTIAQRSFDGFVWHDLDGDGLQSALEPGIPDVVLTLTNETFTITATTDADGNYLFQGVLTEGFTIFINFTANADILPPLPSPANVGGNTFDLIDSDGVPNDDFTLITVAFNPLQTTNTFDFGFRNSFPSSLGGLVFWDVNGNDLLDVTDSGLEGIEVFLVDFEDEVILDSTITNEAGAYSFRVEPNRPVLLAVDISQCGISVFGETGYALELVDADQGDDGIDSDAVIDIASGFAVIGPLTGATETAALDNSFGFSIDTSPGMRFVVKDNFLVPPDLPFEFFLNGTGFFDVFELGGGDLPRAIFFEDIPPGEYLLRPGIVNSEFIDDISCYAPVDNVGNFVVDDDSDVVIINFQPGDTVTCVYEYVVDAFPTTAPTPSPLSDAPFTGRVWLDINQNGLQDAGEPGVEGVLLQLVLVETQQVVAITQTNDEGFFAFQIDDRDVDYAIILSFIENDVPYSVSTPDAFFGVLDDIDSDAISDASGNFAIIPIPAGTTEFRFDFGLLPFVSGIVGGRVFTDGNDDGSMIDEAGVEDVTVILFSFETEEELDSTVTNEDGYFAFLGVPAGTPLGLLVDLDQAEVARFALTLIEPDASVADCADSDAELSNETYAVIEFELDEEGEVNLDFGFGLQVDETPGLRLVVLETPSRSEPFVISQQVLDDSPIPQNLQINGDELPDSLFFAGVPSFSSIFSLENIIDSDISYDVRIDCESFGENSTFEVLSNEVGITYSEGDVAVCTWILEESGVSPTAPPTFDPLLFNNFSVEGVVWNDLNGNGVQERGEPPISGVLIQLVNPQDDTDVLATASTDSDGYYFLSTEIEQEEYLILVNRLAEPNIFLLPSEVSPQDVLSDSLDPIDNDAEFDDTNAFRFVTLTRQGVYDFGFTTDPVICTGGVSPITQAPTLSPTSAPTLPPGPAIIGGRVFLDEDGDFLAVDDPGLSNVEVILRDRLTREELDSTFTDFDGTYEFVAPPNRQVLIQVPLTQFEIAAFRFILVPADVGADDSIDSDAVGVISNAQIELTTVPNSEDLTFFFGFHPNPLPGVNFVVRIEPETSDSLLFTEVDDLAPFDGVFLHGSQPDFLFFSGVNPDTYTVIVIPPDGYQVDDIECFTTTDVDFDVDDDDNEVEFDYESGDFLSCEFDLGLAPPTTLPPTTTPPTTNPPTTSAPTTTPPTTNPPTTSSPTTTPPTTNPPTTAPPTTTPPTTSPPTTVPPTLEPTPFPTTQSPTTTPPTTQAPTLPITLPPLPTCTLGNGDFELGSLDFWDLNGFAVAANESRGAIFPRDGDFFLSFAELETDSESDSVFQTIPVFDDILEVSFFYRTGGLSTASVTVIFLEDGDEVNHPFCGVSDLNMINSLFWQEVEFDCPIPDTANEVFILLQGTQPDPPGLIEVYFDEVSVECLSPPTAAPTAPPTFPPPTLPPTPVPTPVPTMAPTIPPTEPPTGEPFPCDCEPWSFQLTFTRYSEDGNDVIEYQYDDDETSTLVFGENPDEVDCFDGEDCCNDDNTICWRDFGCAPYLSFRIPLGSSHTCTLYHSGSGYPVSSKGLQFATDSGSRGCTQLGVPCFMVGSEESKPIPIKEDTTYVVLCLN